mgnify:CR=1 FL=1
MTANTFFSFFSDRFVINLDTDKDRLKSFYNRLNHYGISNVSRFPAVAHKEGVKGCGFSVLNIIKEAKRRELDSVFVFEDDAEFIDFDAEILDQVAIYLKVNKWELVRLSYTYRKDSKKLKEVPDLIISRQHNNLVEFKKHPHLGILSNFAAIGYHSSTFDRIINSFKPETCSNIDMWMPTNFDSLCVTPQMVIQDEPDKPVTLPSGEKLFKRDMHLLQRKRLHETFATDFKNPLG